MPKLDFSMVTNADEAAEEPEGDIRSTFISIKVDKTNSLEQGPQCTTCLMET